MSGETTVELPCDENGSQNGSVGFNGDHNNLSKEEISKLHDLNEDDSIDSGSSLQTDDNEITSLATAHKAMKSLKDLVPCEFSREAITQSADELINSLNAKRKQDTEMFQDCKKTFELQTKRTCSILEQHMFKVYENQGKTIQDKIQELYAILDRIATLEAKIEQFKRALQGLCHEFN